MFHQFIVICLCFSSSLATNIVYENVTQANFTELSEREIDLPGLSHLFDMSRNFVDIVFRPFSDIEEFAFDLVRQSNEQNSDIFGSIQNRWQDLASFEVGFMVCLVFGCLFVVFVPLVGLIMCCCRTCCNNCGGEMEQSVKRAKSSWRHCFCGTLFILSIFMAIPCVFVYLTNVSASNALRQIPTVTSSALDDLNGYIDNVPVQLEHIINEYQKLDGSLRDNISDIGTSLGVPIRDSFLGFTEPTLNQLSALSNETKEARDALENVQTATEELDNGIGGMNTALSDVQTDLETDLTNAGATCTGNIFCDNVRRSTDALDSTGADFSSLDNIDSELSSINDTLNAVDIDEEVEGILDTINNIPANVSSASQSVTNDVIATLDNVNSTLSDAVQNLPVDQIQDLRNQIDSVGGDISESLRIYNENYDIYRYVAGAVLASVIAVVVVFYWFGMMCGTFSFNQYAGERSACSNCGGILMMAAVGFSFIFSWLLMILVIITFTIGGHGERYLCQNLEAPYEGLRFADEILNRTTSATDEIPISLFTTIQACERNESIYVAADLENIFNVSAAIGDATESINDVRQNLNNLSVDLSNIDTFPPNVQTALNDMRNSGLDSINFTSYIDEISKGLTSQGLVEYAQFLNDSADNMTTLPNSNNQATINLANTIRGHSYTILQIQRNRVDPLSQSLSSLNSSVLRLQDIADGFNDTINNLEDSLQDLNENIRTNGSERVADVTLNFANEIIDDVFGYVNYVLGQLNDRFGACRPVFVVYTKMTQVLCDYLIEVLNGFWFSLGWCVFFLIPSAIVGMKLAKFYRRMSEADAKEDAHWNEMEMDAMAHVNKPDDKLDEVTRAMSVLTGEEVASSDSSVMRSFRAVKSAKEPQLPRMGDPMQRFARSAASDKDEVRRRWDQNKPVSVRVVQDQAEPDPEDSDQSPEDSDQSPKGSEAEAKSSASSEAMGERRAEIRSARNVKSFAHLTQPSVESRDARRTASDVKDAAAILMRWNQSSKVHPEQYY